MATSPNEQTTLVPNPGGFDWNTEEFPSLKNITTADLVGPSGANRQPYQVEKRTNTLRDRVNQAVENWNYWNGFNADGTTDLGWDSRPRFVARDGVDPMTGNLTFNNPLGVRGRETGGTVRNLASMDASNRVLIGDTSSVLRVQAAASLVRDNGSSTFAIWDAENMGPGSGLNADLVDGLQAAQFIRSDVDDDVAGNITFNHLARIRCKESGGTVRNIAHMDASNNLQIGNTNNPTHIMASGSGAYRNGNQLMWDAGNHGPSSGLNADLLDDVQGANYARLDVSSVQTFAGKRQSPSTSGGDAGTTLTTKDYVDNAVSGVGGSGLQSQIDALNADLSNEITNRTNGDNTLQTNINNEASSRANGDTNLQNQINTINSGTYHFHDNVGKEVSLFSGAAGTYFFVAHFARDDGGGSLTARNGFCIVRNGSIIGQTMWDAESGNFASSVGGAWQMSGSNLRFCYQYSGGRSDICGIRISAD